MNMASKVFPQAVNPEPSHNPVAVKFGSTGKGSGKGVGTTPDPIHHLVFESRASFVALWNFSLGYRRPSVHLKRRIPRHTCRDSGTTAVQEGK